MNYSIVRSHVVGPRVFYSIFWSYVVVLRALFLNSSLSGRAYCWNNIHIIHSLNAFNKFKKQERCINTYTCCHTFLPHRHFSVFSLYLKQLVHCLYTTIDGYMLINMKRCCPPWVLFHFLHLPLAHSQHNNIIMHASLYLFSIVFIL